MPHISGTRCSLHTSLRCGYCIRSPDHPEDNELLECLALLHLSISSRVISEMQRLYRPGIDIPLITNPLPERFSDSILPVCGLNISFPFESFEMVLNCTFLPVYSCFINSPPHASDLSDTGSDMKEPKEPFPQKKVFFSLRYFQRLLEDEVGYFHSLCHIELFSFFLTKGKNGNSIIQTNTI